MLTTERTSKVSETIEQAVSALSSTLSTSYGPKGLDKMIIQDKNTIITNDGATIMGFYKTHPIHKILSSVSHTQDINCGDGTTSVILLIGCLMEQAKKLKDRGIHPSKIVEGLEIAKKLSMKYIDEIKVKVTDKEFLNVALTTLNSKIASKSLKMAQVSIDALKISKKEAIRIIKRVGGNIDDIELYNGILLECGPSSYISDRSSNATASVDTSVPESTGNNNVASSLANLNIKDSIKSNTKSLLMLQFCLSAPKTNLDSKILINDYTLMERFVKEEREYVINLIKSIKKSGADFLIIQKSLLRESCSELARHFLKKLNISFIDNVDRKDIEYLAKVLCIKPVTDIDLIEGPIQVEIRRVDDMVEIINRSSPINIGSPIISGSLVCSGSPINTTPSSINAVSPSSSTSSLISDHLSQPMINTGCSIVVSGCDQMVVDEAERSLNDSLCVIKTLIEEPFIVPGGCSVETGISCILDEYSGPYNFIVKEIAAGFLGMPYRLSENAGMYPIDIVSTLKKNIVINKHMGISLRNGMIADMVNDDNVIQPALVSKSMIVLAIETVQMLVRVDDILPSIN